MPRNGGVGRGEKKARTADPAPHGLGLASATSYGQTQSRMPPAQHCAPMPLQPFDMRATFTDEQQCVDYAVYFLDVLEAPERSE